MLLATDNIIHGGIQTCFNVTCWLETWLRATKLQIHLRIVYLTTNMKKFLFVYSKAVHIPNTPRFPTNITGRFDGVSKLKAYFLQHL